MLFGLPQWKFQAGWDSTKYNDRCKFNCISNHNKCKWSKMFQLRGKRHQTGKTRNFSSMLFTINIQKPCESKKSDNKKLEKLTRRILPKIKRLWLCSYPAKQTTWQKAFIDTDPPNFLCWKKLLLGWMLLAQLGLPVQVWTLTHLFDLKKKKKIFFGPNHWWI